MAASLKIKVYVLASPQKRGDAFQTLVFDKTNDCIKTIFMPAKFEKKFSKAAFLLVEASHIGDVIRIGENSRVSLTTKLFIDRNLISPFKWPH